MDDFPGNSRRAKEEGEPPQKTDEVEAKKIKSVTSARRQKPPLGRKFMRTFFEGSSAKDIVDKILFDVLIPDARSMIYEIGMTTLERTIFGDDRPINRRVNSHRPPVNGHTSYASRFQQAQRRNTDEPRALGRRAREMHDFDDIICDTKVEADNVIIQMFEYLENYGQVTVAEMYSLTDITPTQTDYEWGWRDLRDADAYRVRTGGYALKLPRPIPLNH